MGWGTGNIGSGSGGLNFKIVGGTLEPSNSRENNIWVNTDQKITGWYFSAEQPENMKEGELWFLIGTSSPASFNALKKNNITIYPLSVKQYISGTLVNVTAKSYRNGKWVGWILFLYNRGKIGIGGTPKQIYKDGSKEDVVVTLNTNYISINLLGNSCNRAGFPDTVNFSGYSTMKVTVKVPQEWDTATEFRFGVDSVKLTSAAYTAQALDGYTDGTEYTISLDISSYNGTSKPWFELNNDTGQGEENSLYVLEIVLE